VDAAGPILIIEDQPDIREITADILRTEGYEVQTAGNGAEALALLRTAERLPKLLILDLMMPVMSGIEFRREQLRDPRLAAIPVVVLTGSAMEPSSLDAGISAWLRKPVSLEGLLGIVKRFS
jgi:CheY-like chemotaxis protein